MISRQLNYITFRNNWLPDNFSSNIIKFDSSADLTEYLSSNIHGNITFVTLLILDREILVKYLMTVRSYSYMKTKFA